MLTLALDRAGLVATVGAPWSIGLRALGEPLDALLTGVNEALVRSLFEQNDAVVVPGFVALDTADRLVLLGRGGSDLTALFLAQRLKADRCRLVKDVDGLYEYDPALTKTGLRPAPRRYSRLPWSRAIELGGGIVQQKAIVFASQGRLQFEVGAFLQDDATLVGEGEIGFAPAREHGRPPLKVVILGCGNVGLGVYRELLRAPDRFTVAGVVVRDLRKAVALGVRPELLSTDVLAERHRDADVVVEALGGIEPAGSAITAALERGARIVTANKAALGARLTDPAWREAINQGWLKYSATVGGAATVLEAVERLAADRDVEILRLEGVINATTNVVLDGLAKGRTLDAALGAAREAGLAEADASRDLEGRDAADKAAILAYQAWGLAIDPSAIERVPVSVEAVAAVRARAPASSVVRQVATIERTLAGVRAAVRLEVLDAAHPLAAVHSDRNALLITFERSGDQLGLRTPVQVVVRGDGAGRWPTTEAVFADLCDLAREWPHQPVAEPRAHEHRRTVHAGGSRVAATV